MTDKDISGLLQQQVKLALTEEKLLNIVAGNSKSFLGREAVGEPLEVSGHRGIVNYDPRELVITARSGTPLKALESTLLESGQMLAFEPPHFGEQATLGGAVSAGLSGPRRVAAGAVRDSVLGCKLINGKAEVMSFGGQVMKNVAGYDVSRLLAGAYGTLGVLLEVSLKVLPRPASQLTLVRECGQADAIQHLAKMRQYPLPIDATCFHEGRCYMRLAGSERAVKEAQEMLGGEVVSDGEAFWQDLKEQRWPFFSQSTPGYRLWRLVVKPNSPPLEIDGGWLLEWGGGLRWLNSNASSADIFRIAQRAGGHATLFRGGDRQGDVFQSLPQALYQLQHRIKHSFDPQGIFNRGRMYAGI